MSLLPATKGSIAVSRNYMIHHIKGIVMNRKGRTIASSQWLDQAPCSGDRNYSDNRTSGLQPVRLLYPHPLSWWRSRAAGEFRTMDVVIARSFLSRSAVIGEPSWHLGAAGDAAVAVGVALRTRRRFRKNRVLLDIAMTAVLACAVEGDATAAMLLSEVLRQRAVVDPSCSALSDSWLRIGPRKALHSPRSLRSQETAQ